ncbi:hypothetical protein F2P81_021099 [Scophthalmus maximus]|uniref:Uncharacterized protein n=1 Tax=Scophthalmus maximus TaxID=52904 RepID=A0A6A4S4W4_SCOMX|nr:hypothetical protein F2P81_021099 [Scophthalmus maximus]
MGAKFTICCCHFYLNPNRDEKKAILRVRTAPPPRPPEPLSSEPSDSDPEEESLIGREPSEWNLRGNRQSQRGTCDPRAGANVRRESDRELQAFISMRDQADKATEMLEERHGHMNAVCVHVQCIVQNKSDVYFPGYQYEVDDMLVAPRSPKNVSPLCSCPPPRGSRSSPEPRERKSSGERGVGSVCKQSALRPVPSIRALAPYCGTFRQKAGRKVVAKTLYKHN